MPMPNNLPTTNSDQTLFRNYNNNNMVTHTVGRPIHTFHTDHTVFPVHSGKYGKLQETFSINCDLIHNVYVLQADQYICIYYIPIILCFPYIRESAGNYRKRFQSTVLLIHNVTVYSRPTGTYITYRSFCVSRTYIQNKYIHFFINCKTNVVALVINLYLVYLVHASGPVHQTVLITVDYRLFGRNILLVSLF